MLEILKRPGRAPKRAGWRNGAAAGLIAVVFAVGVACGGSGSDDNTGIGPNGPVARFTISEVPTQTPEPELTPTTTPEEEESPEPVEYTVQPGDGLYLICLAEVPDMDTDACVIEAVELNNLAGPEQIEAGQVLLLPGSNPPAAN